MARHRRAASPQGRRGAPPFAVRGRGEPYARVRGVQKTRFRGRVRGGGLGSYVPVKFSRAAAAAALAAVVISACQSTHPQTAQSQTIPVLKPAPTLEPAIR